MVEAAREWGIFQAVNHGVPADAVAELQRVGREFFALPQEEKQRYAMDPASGKTEGYGSSVQRSPGDRKIWSDNLFHTISPPAAVNHGFWPEKPRGYREANEAYCGHMRRLTREVLERLSAGLGLEEGAMAEAFGGGDDGLVLMQKVNFYPPCPEPELVLGFAPHTDLCAFTVLVADDVPGLQVSKDGRWAVLHRVTVSKEKTRMSWPVFVHPRLEYVVAPHPRLVAGEIPAKYDYKAKTFEDYMYCKINKLPQ
ncbi:unnamed protein product [Triticum turgidum subsp. durum]|uniref:Fe2OG dioxygenase domain-containing protein n=1 Tax=Triticum turgidum subsp. durum TaxID=4567 RepID=A0A9R0WV84_TRITD|nr:unnamed protein product [Triticum turgidum subsp. durum]